MGKFYLWETITKNVKGEASDAWDGIKGLKKKKGTVRQIILVVFIVSTLCYVASCFPSIGDYLDKILIKLIGKYPIFNNWISLLDKTAFRHFSVDSVIESAKTIGKGLLYVASKSLLEAFICAFVTKIIDEVLSGVSDKVLINLVGIVFGVLICGLVGKIDSVKIKGTVYALVCIGLMVLGIIIMINPKFNRSKKKTSWHDNQGYVVSKLITLVFGVASTLMTACYASVITLVFGKRVSAWWLLLVSILYIATLIVQYVVEQLQKK